MKNHTKGKTVLNKRMLHSLSIFAIVLILFHAHCKKQSTTPDVNDLTRPVIWVNIFKLSFSALEKGPNPASQIVKIKNSGQQTLDYTLSSEADWISFAPDGGNSTGQMIEHIISINKDGLEAREEAYTVKIMITSSQAYNNPQEIDVSLALKKEPPPEIWVNTKNLNFSAAEKGTDPTPQNIEIMNNGEGTLKYEISVDANWLEVAPMSGTSKTGKKKHTVSVDIAGLKEGTYSGTIEVSDPNATNSPQNVNVTLNITKELPPEIWVSRSKLDFQATAGGADPQSQDLYIKNSGEGTLKYAVITDATWLSISPNSGQSSGTEKRHTVYVSAMGMSAGTYGGTITVSDPNASNSPQNVNVTLNITKELPPEIWISKSNLGFNTTQGGADPQSQDLYIKNSGAGTISYTITTDASWLSVSPNSGQSSGTEKRHTVSVSAAGMSAGTYGGTITVSDPNASNSPQIVGVTLQVTAPLTNNEVGISISPGSGGPGTIVTASIFIKGNTSPISSAFGLKLHFDTSMFQYVDTSKGTLTSSWTAVDGYASSGTITVGGFLGAGSVIPTGSQGSIALVRLKVIYSGSSDLSSQITMDSLIDDISSMTANPSSAWFTYKASKNR